MENPYKYMWDSLHKMVNAIYIKCKEENVKVIADCYSTVIIAMAEIAMITIERMENDADK